MKKINLFIDDIVLKELKKLPGSMSEHIRMAIYEYLRKEQNLSTTSSSVSEYREEGDKYAKS